ncbi:ComF family protein [Holospora curviuscula]|uniref:DNA utilization protein GntX n=1 Tax=Holospora curviuscula TaxID=1082868 RepID=A0A2S5R8V3_9PROT|nr:ComF family protein [Holospora curviuscula]PPE03713.1 DNA utilization protein GntX [Holospora curviuscula]
MISTIFPFRCALCGIKIESLGLCSRCWTKTEFITAPLCALCGDPLGYWGENTLCNACAALPNPFFRHRAVWKYGPGIKQLIFKFKHNHQIWLTEFFGYQMLRLLLEYYPEGRLLIPVPLHPKRLMQRGFNQALLLARWLSRRTGIPYDYSSLRRVKDTDSQGLKPAQERHSNVGQAFHYCPTFPLPINVILVDDVYTTGATLKACANALKAKGVHHIRGITLSKVIPLGGFKNVNDMLELDSPS